MLSLGLQQGPASLHLSSCLEDGICSEAKRVTCTPRTRGGCLSESITSADHRPTYCLDWPLGIFHVNQPSTCAHRASSLRPIIRVQCVTSAPAVIPAFKFNPQKTTNRFAFSSAASAFRLSCCELRLSSSSPLRVCSVAALCAERVASSAQCSASAIIT